MPKCRGVQEKNNTKKANHVAISRHAPSARQFQGIEFSFVSIDSEERLLPRGQGMKTMAFSGSFLRLVCERGQLQDYCPNAEGKRRALMIFRRVFNYGHYAASSPGRGTTPRPEFFVHCCPSAARRRHVGLLCLFPQSRREAESEAQEI